MKKFLAAGTLTLAVIVPGSAFASITTAPSTCKKTYTVKMVKRAINTAYRGTRVVTARDRAHLRRYLRCSRNQSRKPMLHRYWHHATVAWKNRRNPPCTMQLASWYYDQGGPTASGWQAAYGVANKHLPFGTKVRFTYGGRSIWAIVDDRGPYVGGRIWDLGQSTAAALGFDGVAPVCASVSG